MKNRKLMIAIGIIVILLIFIGYSSVIKPKWNKYTLDRKIETQQETIKLIVDLIHQQINQQRYVVIGEGEEAMILIQYIPPEGV